MPDWYLKQPPKVRGDDWWISAFSCLATERSFPGNGVGPIPWSKAFLFGRAQGFDRWTCNFVACVILLLDQHYREHLRDEQNKEAKREAKQAKREAKAVGVEAGLGVTRRRAQRSK
jgi:hypothetical protein